MKNSIDVLDLDVPLVDRVFKFPVVKVFATPLQMSLLNPFIAKEVEEAEDTYTVEHQTGVTHTRSSPMESVIEQMFFGQVTPLSGIEKMDNEYLQHATEQQLTIRDCIILWLEEGKVDYMVPSQTTAVYDVLLCYINEVTRRKDLEINYIPPPDEDMRAMEGFLGNLRALAEDNRSRIHGSAAWNALSALFGNTVAVEAVSQEELDKASSKQFVIGMRF